LIEYSSNSVHTLLGADGRQAGACTLSVKLADSTASRRLRFAAFFLCIAGLFVISTPSFSQVQPPSGETTPWVIYIGNTAYPVPVKPVRIANGNVFLGLDSLRALGGELSFDSETKTVTANLAGNKFVLDIRKKSAALNDQFIDRDKLLEVNNKWYLAVDVWETWGYRPIWHPNFKAWQIIGRITRHAYNDDAKDLVFESTLPFEILQTQAYDEKKITLTILGAFVSESVYEEPGESALDTLKIESDSLGRAVMLDVTQKETTGFRVYLDKNRTFARVNFRNHFQLADYDLTSSGEIRLKVKFAKPTDLSVMELANPDRLVLDFPGCIYTDATKTIDVGIGHVKRVRIGQFSEPPKPYTVRVVVDLSEMIGYRIIPSLSKDTYYIQFLGRMTGKYAIVIDPGHGGSDPGALTSFSNSREKDLNLDIALRVRDLLESKEQTVFMTREGDYYVSLAERAEITNRLLPMFFVSIHNNAFETEEMHGAMTFHYEGSRQGRILAGFIQRRIVTQCGAQDKGVRTANFFVLRETIVPAVLVECGFMTNPDEEAKLRDPNYRRTMAMAIANGILDYCASITR